MPPVLIGGSILAAATTLADDGPSPELLWLGLGALTVGVVTALDEPAAAVADACPRSRRLRLAERLLAPLVVLAGWSGFALALDGRSGISGPTLAWCGVGVMVVALAAAAVLRRRAVLSPAVLVAPGVLLAVVTCLLFQPFLDGDLVVLQAYDRPGADGVLWWVTAPAALLVLLWESRNPGRVPTPR